MHKILIHQYVDSEYSIWIDGNVRLLAAPSKLVQEFLSDADMATFKHSCRSSVYDEARECMNRKLDNPDVIRAQASRYKSVYRFLEPHPLFECTVILRRHTSTVERFNNLWWSEYCVHSARDQISAPLAAEKVGLKVHLITPCKMRHPYFSITPTEAVAEHAI